MNIDAAIEVMRRVASLSLPSKPQRKLTAEQRAARAARATEELVRAQELLDAEMARHKTAMRKLKNRLRRAVRSHRYYEART